MHKLINRSFLWAVFALMLAGCSSTPDDKLGSWSPNRLYAEVANAGFFRPLDL